MHIATYFVCTHTQPLLVYTHVSVAPFGMLKPGPSMGSCPAQAVPHPSFGADQPVTQRRAARTRHQGCLAYRRQVKCEFWVTAIFLSQKRVGGWNQLLDKNVSCCIWETSKLVKKWSRIIPKNTFLTYSQKNIVCDALKSPRTPNSKNGIKPEKSPRFWKCFSNQQQSK